MKQSNSLRNDLRLEANRRPRHVSVDTGSNPQPDQRRHMLATNGALLRPSLFSPFSFFSLPKFISYFHLSSSPSCKNQPFHFPPSPSHHVRPPSFPLFQHRLMFPISPSHFHHMSGRLWEQSSRGAVGLVDRSAGGAVPAPCSRRRTPVLV